MIESTPSNRISKYQHNGIHECRINKGGEHEAISKSSRPGTCTVNVPVNCELCRQGTVAYKRHLSRALMFSMQKSRCSVELVNVGGIWVHSHSICRHLLRRHLCNWPRFLQNCFTSCTSIVAIFTAQS